MDSAPTSPTLILSNSSVQAYDIFINVILIPIYFFSLPNVFRSFFAPYKKTAFVDTAPGISTYFNNMVTSLISRVIGVIIRFFLLVFGVFFFVLFLPIGAFVALIAAIPPFSFLIYRQTVPENISIKPNTTLGEFLQQLSRTSYFRFFLKKTNFPQSIFSQLTDDSTDILSQIPDFNSLSLEQKMVSLYEKIPSLKVFFDNLHLNRADLTNLATWYSFSYPTRSPLILLRKRVMAIRGIGHDLAYGYTINLDKFSKNLLNLETKDIKVLGRQNEIQQIETILSSSRNSNVIIVGEPGVGKHTVAIELARRINNGTAPSTLIHKRVVEIDFHSIISQGQNPEDGKVMVKKILEEAEDAGNIILVIDDLDQFVTSADGRSDISDILIKNAESNKIQIIAMTNQSTYDKYILPNAILAKNFSKITITPLSVPETIKVLITNAAKIQSQQKINLNYFAIKEIVEKSDIYIHTSPLPEKALDLTFEVISFIKNNNLGDILTIEILNQYLTQKIGTNIGKLDSNKTQTLKNLETILHQKIIGQNQAVESVAKALRRRSLQVSNAKKPIGTFLFLGPTGVGKTQTAKVLAEEYFGSQDFVLRLDMSQFQDTTAIDKLIGSSLANQPGVLTSQLATKPNSVLLLDELEKAHPKILNLLLTILDEGYITDGFGKEVKAQNTIIIATSNAGAQLIAELVTQKAAYATLHDELLKYIKENNIFSPEFLNRFDEVVIFHPLEPSHLSEIVKLNLSELNTRLKNEKNITVQVTPELVSYIVKQGYDPQFGARNINRFIQNFVEDYAAKALLENPETSGEITISVPSL